jgi:hypothetical protein
MCAKFRARHCTFIKSKLQPTILNDNVNQFKVGLESDKGYFTLKVKTVSRYSGEHGISHTNLYVIKKNYLL